MGLSGRDGGLGPSGRLRSALLWLYSGCHQRAHGRPLEAREVEDPHAARGEGEGLSDLVDEARLEGLSGAVPGLLAHGAREGVLRHLRLGEVGAADGARDLVEDLGHVAHVGGRADDRGEGIVDHEEGVGGHHHPVAGQRDHGGDRGGDAVDVGGDPGGVASDRVEDRLALEDRAAGGVDVEGDARDLEGGELGDEGPGRHALLEEAGADLVVDVEVGLLGLG